MIQATIVLLAALAGDATPKGPGPTQQAPPCRVETLDGRVSRGDSFETSLPGGLVFQLEPELMPQNPAGWTIRVSPESAREDDYSMVATPPYRFWNPRYVDTSYGVTATEALALNRRDFAFVAFADDYRTAREALDVLLWPGSRPDEEVQAAAAELSALRTYPATFWILDGTATPPDSTRPGGAIDSLSFRVELCVPDELRGAR